MRDIFTLTLLIIAVQLGNAQYFKGKESFNQLVKKANLAYENGEQLYALEYARRAARMDTTRLDLWYRVGELASELTIIDEAKQAYTIAAKHENRADYPLIDFNYGNVLRLFGECEAAKLSYQRFLEEYSNSEEVSDKIIKEAKKYLEECNTAPLPDEEIILGVKRVDMQMNAPCRSTFAPYLNGNELHFTSLFFPNEADTTELKNAKFNIFKQDLTRSSQLETIGDDTGRSAHFALSLDKTKMYYTQCEYLSPGKYRCDIYRSERNPSGTWAAGERLPDGVNGLGFTSTQPSIGTDMEGNEILFFASDRPQMDGTTDMDIWQSRIIPMADGGLDYGEPINLSAINTAGDEVTPFYHEKCQTLYFSTNGRATFGNLDIYQTKRVGNNWSKPETMDYPVNSSFNDNYFFRSEDGAMAYFASNRVTSEDLELQDCKGCCPKIYEAPIRMPVNLEIIAACGEKPLTDFTYSLAAGDLRVKSTAYDTPIELQPNTTYELELQKDGFYPAKFEYQTEEFCDSVSLEQRIYMQPKNNLTVEIFGQTGSIVKDIDTIDRVTLLSPNNRTFEVREAVAVKDLSFTIKPDITYTLIAEKEGYRKDSVQIKALDISEICTPRVALTLREDLPDLPATLYFHNAIPAIEDYSDKSNVAVSYQTTYDNYLEIIALYRNELKAYYNRTGELGKANAAFAQVDTFFTREVKRGFEVLKRYAAAIVPYMREGQTVQICMQGMASPLASDEYNQYLSERRINSVRNFLREFEGGILAPYIDKELTITELPLGEAKVSEEEKEKMENRSFGIYAPEAAMLRNVTIIDIQAQGADGCQIEEE